MLERMINWMTGKPQVVKVKLPDSFDRLEVVQANQWWS